MTEIINHSSIKISKASVNKWMKSIRVHFEQKKIRNKKNLGKNVSIVFLNRLDAKKINRQFRKKDYATDVLSFAPMASTDLGELIICPQVIRTQAKEHGLSFDQELGYMLIHGVLHLLGYDHELSAREAALMFGLQDELFEKLTLR